MKSSNGEQYSELSKVIHTVKCSDYRDMPVVILTNNVIIMLNRTSTYS